MNIYLKSFVILLLFSTTFFIGCEEVEENPDTEDKTFPNAFSYKLDNYDVDLSEGGVIVPLDVDTNPEIRFKKDKGLEPGKLKVDLYEFIDETMREVYTQLNEINAGPPITVSITIDDPDNLVAEISGNRQFEIDEFAFTLFIGDETYSSESDCEFSAEGKIDADKITLEFEMSTGPILYEGTAEGKRNR